MKEILKDFNRGFSLAKNISESNDNQAMIEVMENWNYIHDGLIPIFSNLVESFGFYPYLDPKKLGQLNLAGQCRNEFHKSDFLGINGEKIRFHYEQKKMEEIISDRKNLILSAPTSFGKSLLIEEFVARNTYKNILIIQPTLALIDETRKKLQKYSEYTIIVNTKQELRDKNIFILTSERVLEILNKLEKLDLGFFVIDEFYKIASSKHDERISQLNLAFYKIMSLGSPQLLLLTPNVDKIDEEFIEKYNLTFVSTEYSLVNQNLNKIAYKDEKDKKKKFFNLLRNIEEQTIVYVKSPKQAEVLASEYIEYTKLTSDMELPIFEWIDEHISREWSLKKFLKSRLGIHNGQYPRHIVNSQLDYFNKGDLKVIFATTSLIEGVNTSAKNIIIFDMKKGNKKLSYFDFNNIKSRAGRMMQHFSGNIYYFDNPPKKDIEKIDIPIVEQSDELQSEILINLDTKDIKSNLINKYDLFTANVPNDLLEIIKKNYYDVESQLRLYNYLLSNREKIKLLSWREPLPRYSILEETFRILQQYLDGKKGKEYTYLSQKSIQLIRNNLSEAIREQIKHNSEKSPQNLREEIVSKSVSEIFRFIRTKAKFELPKKLAILESIINYLSPNSPADYSAFIALLENEGVNTSLNILLDYGVPSSAIRKIKLPNDIESEQMIDYIKFNINDFNFSIYEQEIIKQL